MGRQTVLVVLIAGSVAFAVGMAFQTAGFGYERSIQILRLMWRLVHFTAFEAGKLLERLDQVRRVLGADQAIEQRLAQDYLEANSRFHLLLYGACGNPVLLRSIESLWLQIGPFFNRLFTGADLSLRLNDFHEEAFAAIEAGDAKAARQAMEQDLIYFARFLLNLLELEQRPVPAR